MPTKQNNSVGIPNKEAAKLIKRALKGLQKVPVYNTGDDTTSQDYYVKDEVVLFKTFYMFSGKQSDFAMIISSKMWSFIQNTYKLSYKETCDLFLHCIMPTNAIRKFINKQLGILSFPKIRIVGPMDDRNVNLNYNSQIGLVTNPVYLTNYGKK